MYVPPDQVDAQAKTNHTWLVCKAGLGNTAIEYLKFSDDDHARVVRLDGGSRSFKPSAREVDTESGDVQPGKHIGSGSDRAHRVPEEMHG